MTLEFKVYGVEDEHIADFKNDFDAAFFVAGQRDGTTIRIGYRKRDIVWTEGLEEDSAGQSYSATVAVIRKRVKQKRKGRRA